MKITINRNDSNLTREEYTVTFIKLEYMMGYQYLVLNFDHAVKENGDNRMIIPMSEIHSFIILQ